jgi:hypothetical protein
MTPVLTRETPHKRKLKRRAVPVAPRRVSGPIPGRQPARPQLRRVRRQSAPARAIALIRGLPDHRLLDRLLRGRAWIPLLGVLLAGIVAMQVSMLKLGSTIGRSVERGASLQSTNEQLRASVASLADEQRIERLAAGMGMVMAAPQAIGFLGPKAGVAAQAAANLKAPDPSAFLAALQASGGPAPGTSSDPNAGASGASGATSTGSGAALTSSGATSTPSGAGSTSSGGTSGSSYSSATTGTTGTQSAAGVVSNSPGSSGGSTSSGGVSSGSGSGTGSTGG